MWELQENKTENAFVEKLLLPALEQVLFFSTESWKMIFPLEFYPLEAVSFLPLLTPSSPLPLLLPELLSRPFSASVPPVTQEKTI